MKLLLIIFLSGCYGIGGDERFFFFLVFDFFKDKC